MIKISILTEILQFESYKKLCDCLMMIENLKTITKRHDFTNWSFTVFSTKRVAALYTHNKDQFAAVSEAFKEGLPLIEICTGDYENPQYIVVTPNVDIEYLRRKWCLNYCAFHHLEVREDVEEEACLPQIGKEIIE